MSGKPDNNYASFADRDGVVVDGQSFDPKAEGYTLSTFADVLKFSRLTNSLFANCTVHARGASENALDANRRCDNVSVRNVQLLGGAQASIVVKGNCTRMNFDGILLFPDPKAFCEVLWDDWSDQSSEASTGSLTNVERADGKPVRVVFGRFSCPQFVGGNCRVSWFKTIGLHLYNYVFKGPLRACNVL